MCNFYNSLVKKVMLFPFAPIWQIRKAHTDLVKVTQITGDTPNLNPSLSHYKAYVLLEVWL